MPSLPGGFGLRSRKKQESTSRLEPDGSGRSRGNIVTRQDSTAGPGITRRDFLLAGAVGVAVGTGLLVVPRRYFRPSQRSQVFVAKLDHYQLDLAQSIRQGMRALGLALEDLKGKR